ncbi:MAG TPA: hypothetical protein VMF30_02650 [Pirellulales bacterium]|nr:hypothetical protein [Pirellulales bacterium]
MSAILTRKLGKHAPKHDPRTLRLAKYLAPDLPSPPANCDWTAAAKAPWGMMLNDTLGDCTCAAMGHEVQVVTANHGNEATVSNQNVLVAYEAVSGYVPGQPNTDTGANMLDVLKYWRATGIGGHKILAFAKVNPLDWLEVRQAIALFGGLYIGLALPTSAENQNTWSLAGAGPRPFAADFQPGSWGGHCVFVPAYTAEGFMNCITWGAPKLLTRAWFRVMCDEAYVVVSSDWASATTAAPNGLNIAQLLSDLAAIE